MAQFAAHPPNGDAVQQLEVLLRTALFKPANALLGFLLQQAADRLDAAYQPKPGQVRKGREERSVQGIFGSFTLARDYYYHPGKAEGHFPADAGLGLRWVGVGAHLGAPNGSGAIGGSERSGVAGVGLLFCDRLELVS